MIDQPGFYPDMPAQDYFADPAPKPSLTQSIAKILLERSPLHAWHAHPRLGGRTDEPEDYTSAKAIGNAAHKLLLGRGREVVQIEAPDFRTLQARSARDAVAAEGKVAILVKHFGRAAQMAKIAHERLQMLGFGIDKGQSELVLAWEQDGTWYRSMIDNLSADCRIVLDYKTTGMCCAPHVLGRMMVEAGWDLQAAMHERGLNALHPESAGRRRHIFVAQENEEPYAVTVAELSESVMTMGRKKLAAADQLWRMCQATNNWPGYPSQIIMPEYPGYAESQWLDREESEFSGNGHRLLHELSRRKDEGEPLGGHARAVHNILMGG